MQCSDITVFKLIAITSRETLYRRYRQFVESPNFSLRVVNAERL